MLSKKKKKNLESRLTDLEDAFYALTDYLDVNVVQSGFTVKDKSVGFKIKGDKK